MSCAVSGSSGSQSLGSNPDPHVTSPRTAAPRGECSPSCRVCLDPCDTSASSEDSTAYLLACRCDNGKVAMHDVCARKWFLLRASVVCEVCQAEAQGLPDDLKEACAKEAAARSAARSQPEHAIYIVSPDGTQVSTPVLRALFRPIPHPYHSVPTYLAAYAAFCLLPGLLFSLAVLFFSYKVMGASLAVTMAISVVESSVTILVWVISPTKTCVHFLFVVLLMGCTFSAALLCQLVFPYAAADLQMTVGACMGMVTCSIIQVYLVLPLIAQWQALMRHLARERDANTAPAPGTARGRVQMSSRSLAPAPAAAVTRDAQPPQPAHQGTAAQERRQAAQSRSPASGTQYQHSASTQSETRP